VDYAELLTATEATSDLVFDPRCLGGDKPLACFYRTTSVILFQTREFDHCLVQALSKFCINSTSLYPEHLAPSELFNTWMGTSIGKASIGAGWRRCAEASSQIRGSDSRDAEDSSIDEGLRLTYEIS
jgi:hypothetical protein